MDLESFVSQFSSPESPVAMSVIISHVKKCAESINNYTSAAYRGESYINQFMRRCELAIRYARLFRSIESDPYESETITLDLKTLVFETVYASDRITLVKNARTICVLVKRFYLRDGNTSELFENALKLEGKL